MGQLNNRPLKILTIILLVLLTANLIFLIIQNPASADTDNSDTDNTQASLTPIDSQESVTSDPGKNVNYKLNLRNDADLPETFHIEVSAEFGWEVELSESDKNPTVGAHQSREITVNIKIPDQLDRENYEIHLDVTSKSLPDFRKVIHAIATENGIIITTELRPILIVIIPPETYLGTIKPGETINVDVEVKCFLAKAVVYLDFEVLKIIDSEQENDENLKISSDPASQEINKGSTETFKVTIELPKKANDKGEFTSTIRIFAKAFGDEPITWSKSMTVLVYSEPENFNIIGVITSPPILVGISSLLFIGAVGAAIGSHEAGKYWLLSLLFIPLYTKLHKNKILDHFTRGRVYEYIRNNPGVHYSEIKRELKINNGSLAYHIHTLEREELIRSRTSGRFKLFFPTDVQIPKNMEPQVNLIRRQILDIVRDEPGITQKEIGEKLPNKTQRTISYHIKNMSREGILRLEKAGRETKCYITDRVVEIKNNGVVFEEAKGVSSDELSDGMFRQI